jgi:hypothetical protein
MTSQRTTASHGGAGPSLAGALSVVLWLLASGLLAFAPLFYFASGGSDSATAAERFTAALIIIVAACPLLALSIGLARHARGHTDRATKGRVVGASLLLLLLACILFELARRLGDADALGDAGWTLYWLLCVWVWLCASWLLVASSRLGWP